MDIHKNLSESNKYLFGTDDTSEIQKLFENETETLTENQSDLSEDVLMEASMYYFGDYVPLLEKMSERKVSARNEKIVKEYHDKVAKIDTQTDLTLKRMRRERDAKADKAKDPEQKKRIRETYDKKIDMVEKMAKNKKDAAAHEKEIKLEKLSADSEKNIWTKKGREARKDSKAWSKLEKSMKD